MREPGDLKMLPDAGLTEWGATVERVLMGDDPPARLCVSADRRTPHLLATDWPGLPQRVMSCVGRVGGLQVLDWPGERGDEGRRRLQEEYLEWRTVRSSDGLIRRVELTTELPEYWRVFAAHAPAELLATVAEFARQDTVNPAAVFGECDPFDDATTSEQRGAAFDATMVSEDGRSVYNSGEKAICCMVQRTNTLAALAALTRAALRTCTVPVDGGEPRPCLSAADVLPLMRGLAQPARASDPLLVERLTRLAWDGRLVAFEDPIGVYIRGVEHWRLRTPDGGPVPPEWFRFSRGGAAHAAPDGLARHQRVTFEAPPTERYAVGDLVDIATEAPIEFGGQIAELCQVSIYLRASDPGVAPPEGLAMSMPVQDDVEDGCADVRAHHEECAA